MKIKTLVFTIPIVFITTILALLGPLGFGTANQFKENVHYKIIAQQCSQDLKVTELFSVYCSTCYLWEKSILTKIKINLEKQQIKFEQAHSLIAGSYAKQLSTVLAIAKYDKNYDAVKENLFRIVRTESKKWKSEKDFFKSLEGSIISEQHYKENSLNLEVVKTLIDWQNISEKTDVIPSLIINDKYLIFTQKIKNIDELESIIDFLLNISK